MKKLYLRRKFLGFTQAEIADMSGISLKHYNSIEQGKCSPTIKIALRIAKVLKVDCGLMEKFF